MTPVPSPINQTGQEKEPHRPGREDSESDSEQGVDEWNLDLHRPTVNGDLNSENSESGSDDDDARELAAPDGYEALPQDAPDENECESEWSSRELGAVNPSEAILEMVQEAAEQRATEHRAERLALWSSSERSPQGDINLDSDKMENIRRLMSTVELPESAIPSWAKGISEEQWQDILKQKLKQGNSGSSSDT